jgi:hypothetical protein
MTLYPSHGRLSADVKRGLWGKVKGKVGEMNDKTVLEVLGSRKGGLVRGKGADEYVRAEEGRGEEQDGQGGQVKKRRSKNKGKEGHTE